MPILKYTLPVAVRILPPFVHDAPVIAPEPPDGGLAFGANPWSVFTKSRGVADARRSGCPERQDAIPLGLTVPRCSSGPRDNWNDDQDEGCEQREGRTTHDFLRRHRGVGLARIRLDRRGPVKFASRATGARTHRLEAGTADKGTRPIWSIRGMHRLA